eukprot:TCONS_00070314-protein
MEHDEDPLLHQNDQEESERMTVDEILTKSGPFGRYQLGLLLICMFIFSNSVSFQSLVTYYTADDPPWKCVDVNISSFCTKGPFQEGTKFFTKRCHLKRNQWEYTRPKTYSFTTEFDLVCSKEYLKALSTALFFIGGMIGAVLSGPLADAYGRKPVIIGGFFAEFLAALAGYFVTAPWQYLVLRTVIGAGFGALTPTVYIYLSESNSPKSRGWVGNIYFFGFTFSMMIVSMLAYYVPSWRKLVLYTSAFPLLSFIGSWFLMESPHWLSSKEQFGKAEDVLKKMGKFNGKPLKVSLVRNREKKKSNFSYVHLFNKWRVFVLTSLQCYLWFGIGLVFYAIALESSNLGGNLYTNFILSSLADVPGYAITIFMSIYVGRKKVVVAGFSLSCLFLIAIGLTPETYTMARVGMAISGRMGATLAFNTLFLWTFEIYPTVVRSKGMNICQMFSRLGSAAAPFLTSVLQDIDPKLPYFIMAGFAVAGTILCLFLPEMLGKPTREEYKELFDENPTIQVTPPINEDEN